MADSFWGNQPLVVRNGSLETSTPEDRLAILRQQQEAAKASESGAQAALTGSTAVLAAKKAEAEKRESILRELANAGDPQAKAEWLQATKELEILSGALAPKPSVQSTAPAPVPAPSGAISAPPSTSTGAGVDIEAIRQAASAPVLPFSFTGQTPPGGGVLLPGEQGAMPATPPEHGYIEWVDQQTGQKIRKPVGTGLSGIDLSQPGESGRVGGLGFATAGPAVEESRNEDLARQAETQNLLNDLYLSQLVAHPAGEQYGLVTMGEAAGIAKALEEARLKASGSNQYANLADVLTGLGMQEEQLRQRSIEIGRRITAARAQGQDTSELDRQAQGLLTAAKILEGTQRGLNAKAGVRENQFDLG